MATIASALALAAPAYASGDDENFLTALSAWGVHYTSPQAAISLGRRLCVDSAAMGMSADQLVSEVAAEQTFGQERMYAASFVRNALGTYCPTELFRNDPGF